ncbi:hypothetical protein FRB94_012349 [Tulasnella sp. JGI-2019a]|nr:hypothetical protein FRB93_000735 [Tulasnella sp. JGI-2019a]KAG9009280.1 hypothetical protein FRB94_012349 [Tulasnella sp. JGI-2019a]KAG9033598.1 hypothetical protein FRB95_014586 [Tulasnella sp. JGI-2019a]
MSAPSFPTPLINDSQPEGQDVLVPGHNQGFVQSAPTGLTTPAPIGPPSQSQGSNQPDQEDMKDESWELSKIIESERQGWIVSAQAAAVVAALLCGVEASLLTLIKTDPSNSVAPPPRAAFRFLLGVSYTALVFNASSTIASLVMLDCLGEIPMLVAKAAPKAAANIEKKIKELQGVDSMDDYLGHFRVGLRWKWARRYCIGSLFVGSSCIFVQVVTYTWIREAISVAAFISVVCMIGFVPLVILFLPERKREQIGREDV